jgi:signal transduction histidine kinase
LLREAENPQVADKALGRLNAMARVALRVCEQPDLPDLGLFVYRQLCGHVSVDLFWLALAEQQSQALRSVLVMKEGRECPPRSLHVSDGDRDAATATILGADDLPPHLATLGGKPLSSAIFCAMRGGGKFLGQLVIGSFQPAAFTLEDGQFVQAIADQLTAAVERDRYRLEAEQREGELRAQLQSSRAPRDSAAMDDALRELAQSLLSIAGADAAIVTLWDAPNKGGIPVAYAAGPGISLEGLLDPLTPEASRPTRARLRGGAYIHSGDREALPMRWPRAAGWQVQVTFPMIVDDEALGMVEIGSIDLSYAFTPRVAEVCQAIVQQAALGLYHARLSASAAEQTTSLSRLAAFSEALNATPDELDSTLRLICDQARRLLNMSHASLYLLQPSEQLIDMRSRSGIPGPHEPGARLAVDLPNSIVARAVRERHMVMETDSGQEGVLGERAVEMINARSVIAAPLRHNGVTLGVLLLTDRRRRKAFQPEDVRLATGISGQAAAAIARSQLRAVEQERLQIASVLGAISASIGTDERQDQTYGLILREAASLLAFDQASISLFEDSSVTVPAAIGTVLARLPQHPSTLRLWREPNSLDLAACLRDPGLVRSLAAARFTDLLSLPLMVNGSVAGRLTFASQQPSRFDGHQVELAALLAERTAHVMGVVQLREAQQEALAKLTNLDELRQDFVATVSHELRTPLTGILGYLELMLSRWTTLDEPHRLEMLQRTQSAATRLEHLVKDLLLFSNVEHQALLLDLAAQPVATLLEQAGEVMRTKYRDQQIDIAPDDAPVRVIADAQRTVQVIANLLDNAIKYSPVGTLVQVGAKTRKQHVEIIVRDRGPGIQADDIPRLFTRFGTLGHQPRPGQVGSGIGLYVCKKLVEAMNGRIWVVSQAGKGSSFHFTLPRAD